MDDREKYHTANGRVEIYSVLKKIFVAVVIFIAVSVPSVVFTAAVFMQKIENIEDDVAEMKTAIRNGNPVVIQRLDSAEKRLEKLEDKYGQ